LATVGELQRALREAPGDTTGVDPEQLRVLGRTLSYDIDICWAASGTKGYFDAVFKRSSTQAYQRHVASTLTRRKIPLRPWSQYANNPLHIITSDNLPSQLRALVREKLPDYMVPSTFVQLQALPLTANGKVDRRAVPAPSMQQEPRSGSATRARNPVEETVAAIWCEVLGRSQVGMHEDFFDIGGHSLLATRLLARVQAVLQVEISLRSLFEVPTVAGLAGLVEQALHGGRRRDVPPLRSLPRTQDFPLSFAQQRLWFLDQLDPGNTAYLIPSVQQLYGVLDSAALERSLEELVRRHEVLRTTFLVRADQPVQIIHPADTYRLPLVDLSGLEQEERVSEARQLAGKEARLSCDLTQGPLLRTRLLRLHSEEHVLLLTMHHIIADGWSNDVFYRELAALYRAFATGEPSPLPPLLIQYADFAVWQRQWLQGDVLTAHLDYWKTQLRDPLPILHLPTDRPRPPIQSFQGAVHYFRLSSPLSIGLKTLGQQEGATLFMTLLAAFLVLLHYYTGQDDIVVGTDVANRNRIETEGLIGFFVNQLVLRTDLAGNPSFREVLGCAREVALGAYVHQDLPFDRLVEVLKPERNLNRTPLFQVKFVLQNASERMQTLSQITTRLIEPERRTAKFDLLLNISESDQHLFGCFEYSTDIFDVERIIRMIEHFETVLDQAVAHPDSRLDRLEALLAAADREEQRLREQELQQMNLQKLKLVRRKVHHSTTPKEG
jgi:acyl carrier protein